MLDILTNPFGVLVEKEYCHTPKSMMMWVDGINNKNENKH